MAQTIILKELLDYAVELLLKLVREYLGQAHASHPCSLWTELMPRGLCKYFCNADAWVRNAPARSPRRRAYTLAR